MPTRFEHQGRSLVVIIIFAIATVVQYTISNSFRKTVNNDPQRFAPGMHINYLDLQLIFWRIKIRLLPNILEETIHL